MKEIKLTQGKVALVDDEDFERVNQFKWMADKSRYTYYAVRNIRTDDGKRTRLRLHRYILNMSICDLNDVDHKNGNGLDNQKNNLRVCSAAQNLRNRVITKHTSQYKGVSLHVKTLKYYATLQINKKRICLGYFPYTPEGERLAALAYNDAAKKYHGEFARLNNL